MKGNGELTLQDVLDAMNAGFARLEGRLDQRIDELEHRVNRRFDGLLENLGHPFRDHERRIVALEKAKKR